MVQRESFLGHLTHDSWFGGKTIGYFAGVALLINNITGPGVPSLANMFAESGWLIPTIVLILVWIMSNISTTMYCEAMRKIPGNEHFRDRIEYTSIVDYYFGRKAYLAAQVGLNGALQSLNIISVIQSAQVMDNAISAMFGHSCGINISPFALHNANGTMDESTEVVHRIWSCIDTNNVETGNPWGCHVIVTMGYLVALVITVPMGYFNLDDNMIVQVVAFCLTLLCWLVWLVACFFSDTFQHGDYSLPAVASGNPWNSQAAVIGTILFNFGFVTTVPSWVNEKKASVSINKVVWLSTFLCNAIFFVMGIPGAMAFRKYLAGPATGECEDDKYGCAESLMDIYTSRELTPSALQHGAVNWILQFSVYLFPIVAVMSSIPVFSIVIKYNCVENGFSHRFAFLWGVLFPWIVSLPLLYQPGALNQFITFSSLIFVSFTDFIVPWALFIVLQRKESQMISKGISPEIEFALPDGATERQALLGAVNNDFDDSIGAVLDEAEQVESLLKASNITAHFAFPPSWRWTPVFKSRLAFSLVIVMAAAALAGTILQIQTSADTTWDCAFP